LHYLQRSQLAKPFLHPHAPARQTWCVNLAGQSEIRGLEFGLLWAPAVTNNPANAERTVFRHILARDLK